MAHISALPFRSLSLRATFSPVVAALSDEQYLYFVGYIIVVFVFELRRYATGSSSVAFALARFLLTGEFTEEAMNNSEITVTETWNIEDITGSSIIAGTAYMMTPNLSSYSVPGLFVRGYWSATSSTN
jgi:hypothetical protein